MKRQIIYFATILSFFISCCSSQNKSKEIYNKDFKWKIVIPENFENVPSEQWEKLKSKGQQAVENTYDQEIVNNAKTIFIFRTDEMNYFESNYQPFDVAVDGEYLESCRNVNNILYETFMTQMPGIKVDSSSATETISGLVFQKLTLKILYPNDLVLNVLMYSRLFDKKEFSVNIMYVDNKKGEAMLNSWTKSKFE
jgi:hypothetical protein